MKCTLLFVISSWSSSVTRTEKFYTCFLFPQPETTHYSLALQTFTVQTLQYLFTNEIKKLIEKFSRLDRMRQFLHGWCIIPITHPLNSQLSSNVVRFLVVAKIFSPFLIFSSRVWGVRGYVSMCLCHGWWMCLLLFVYFFCLLSLFYLALSLSLLHAQSKFMASTLVVSTAAAAASIIVSNCVFALENWLQTFSVSAVRLEWV